MFDIGFWELTLISLVSLVILGPQRLPQTVRFVLSWIQRTKQFASDLGTKLESEVGLEQLKQGNKREFDGKLSAELNEVQQSLAIPRVRPRTSRSVIVNDSAAEPKQAISQALAQAQVLDKKESNL